jgi:hypothetical protein
MTDSVQADQYTLRLTRVHVNHPIMAMAVGQVEQTSADQQRLPIRSDIT